MVEPDNLEALLSMGVSHTNELDVDHAVRYLHQWLKKHPVHRAVIPADQPDASQRLAHVQMLFGKVGRWRVWIGVWWWSWRALLLSSAVDLRMVAGSCAWCIITAVLMPCPPPNTQHTTPHTQAAAASPQDVDVHSALGVLHNLSRNYEDAAAAFRFALSLRPDDYSLWNKLGATLANGNKSAEALAAYQRALDAKPNYMRAWTNMGIAYANLGNYAESARCDAWIVCWWLVWRRSLTPPSQALCACADAQPQGSSSVGLLAYQPGVR